MLEGFVQVPITLGNSFLSISEVGLSFNKNVVKRMQKAENVILLCNAEKKQLALQKCNKRSENSVPFYRDEKTLKFGVRFNNRELLQMIVSMMDWDLKVHNYRVDGFLTDDANSMIFDLNTARKFVKKKRVRSEQENFN